MKRILMEIGLLFALFSSPLLAAELTLSKAMDVAVERDPRIHEAKEALREAEEYVTAAQGAYRPTIRGQGEWGEYRNEDDTVRDGMKRVVGLEAAQNVWSSGRNEAAVAYAEAHVAVMGSQLRERVLDLQMEVAEAWLDVVRADKALALHHGYEDNLLAQLQGAEEKGALGIGRITDIRLLRARTQHAGAKRREAEVALRIAQQVLQQLLGREEHEILGQWPNRDEWPLPKQMGEQLIVSLPRYKEMQAEIEKAEYLLHKQKSERKFSLDLKANVQRGQWGGEKADNHSVSLLLNLPIYEGGTLRSKERSAAQQVVQSKQRLLQVEEELELSLYSNHSSWEGAIEVVQLMEEAVAAEQEAERGIHEEVKAGVRSLIDGLKATEELLQRQIELNGAEHQFWRAHFALLRCGGVVRR